MGLIADSWTRINNAYRLVMTNRLALAALLLLATVACTTTSSSSSSQTPSKSPTTTVFDPNLGTMTCEDWDAANATQQQAIVNKAITTVDAKVSNADLTAFLDEACPTTPASQSLAQVAATGMVMIERGVG